MVDIGIHNVKNIEIHKHKLDSGVWVCNIYITSQTIMSKEQSKETINLFTNNEKVFDNIKI